MPTLHLNGRAIEAPEGATILEAARAAGIEIPTLSWYPKLPTAGNCRICVVSLEGSAKLVPACATKITAGMRINSESPEVQDTRRSVLSLLLERYPAEHLDNGGRSHPENEFERYVVHYGAHPSPGAVRPSPVGVNSMVISARISDRVARKQLFVPFHFREAAANLLTSPVLEPHTKMAALKVVAVKVTAVERKPWTSESPVG